MKYGLFLIIFIVGCSIPPELKEEYENLKSALVSQKAEFQNLNTETEKLRQARDQGVLTSTQYEERLRALTAEKNLKEATLKSVEDQLQTTQVKIAEFQGKVVSSKIGQALDITDNIWSVLSPFLIPFLPFLGIGGPLLKGIRAVVKG